MERLKVFVVEDDALLRRHLVELLGGEPGMTVVGEAGAGDDEIIRTGSCSGSADWKTKAKSRDGRIEFEGEVDSNTSGQKWAWKIKDNGQLVAKGSATTGGPSGSFDVERRIADTQA